MLRRLYEWTMSLAGRQSAEIWLAVIAFVESSVFLVPADMLFVPMVIARPERAYRYALVATVASVLGGIAGWYLGHYAFDGLARPILEFYGKLDAFEALRRSASSHNAILLLLITSGVALNPYLSSGISSASATVRAALKISPEAVVSTACTP